MDGLSAVDLATFRDEMIKAAWDRYAIAYLANWNLAGQESVEFAAEEAGDFADTMMRVRLDRVGKWVEN